MRPWIFFRLSSDYFKVYLAFQDGIFYTDYKISGRKSPCTMYSCILRSWRTFHSECFGPCIPRQDLWRRCQKRFLKKLNETFLTKIIAIINHINKMLSYDATQHVESDRGCPETCTTPGNLISSVDTLSLSRVQSYYTTLTQYWLTVFCIIGHWYHSFHIVVITTVTTGSTAASPQVGSPCSSCSGAILLQLNTVHNTILAVCVGESENSH